MQTVLFHSTIFGPIHSRRLGVSLGVNLMPDDGKVCTFDCLYCEAGYNAQGAGTTGLPTREQVREMLEAQLQKMQAESAPLDVITFSGNGEPTLHPEFPGVIDDTLELRDRYYPQAKVSVLTNSTRQVGQRRRCYLPRPQSAYVTGDDARERHPMSPTILRTGNSADAADARNAQWGGHRQYHGCRSRSAVRCLPPHPSALDNALFYRSTDPRTFTYQSRT